MENDVNSISQQDGKEDDRCVTQRTDEDFVRIQRD